MDKAEDLDDEVTANFGRTGIMIDDHRRKAGLYLASNRHGRVLRGAVEELQAKCRAGEKVALAQLIDKWARRAGLGLGVLV